MRERFYTDGRVSIGIEPQRATIRLYDGAHADGDKPTASGSMQLEKWADDVCAIKVADGERGSLTIRHLALFAADLRARGFRWLIAERTHGALPLFTRIDDGILAGWWLCDLQAAAERAEQRRERAACP